MAGVSGPCPTCSQTIAAPVHKRWHPWRLQICSLLSSRILKFLAIIKHQRRNCNRSPNLFPRRPTKLPLNVAAGAAASSQKSRADDLSDCGAPA
ncbi:hypothetical protein N9Z15_05545, partial [Akkermansiaceae bacterium]|nr:hypothetical protein [Akkermansiaceae bacterium]